MQPRILAFEDLRAKGITLSKCQIWRLENAGQFPKRVHVTSRCIGWLESEIDALIAARIAARDKAA